MTNFLRDQNDTLQIRLDASESSGLRDYYGNEGFITLYKTDGTLERMLAVFALELETPTVPRDVWSAETPMAGLDDGTYELRGLAVDDVGNATILSAYSLAVEGTVQAVQFGILTGQPLAPVDTAITSLAHYGAASFAYRPAVANFVYKPATSEKR